MKTHPTFAATLIAPRVLALSSIMIVATSQQANAAENGPMILDVYASHTGPVTKAQMEASPAALSSTAVVPQSAWTTASCNFGCKLRSKSGANGTLVVTRLSYDLIVNGAPGLDANNAPMTNLAFGAFSNADGSGVPSLRAFNGSDVVVSTQNVQTSGSTIAGAQKLTVEKHGLVPTGSARRPYLGLGKYYAVRFHATGTFDGAGFTVDDIAYVMAEVPTPLNLRTTCFSDHSVDLAWDNVAGETGYSVEVSTDNGGTWIPQPIMAGVDVTTWTVNGLDNGTTSYLFRVKAQGVSAGGESVPSNSVGNRRIVANSIQNTKWSIAVHGYPFSVSDLQFSSDLQSWGSAPEGTVIEDGTGFTRTVSVPMGTNQRMYARIKPCMVVAAE